ncbi:hypothetical protein JSQ81_02935 [Sporosarcina sp. Marseille-Q4063]|uniref:DUF6710 family protein n=1 Tax=Sporosarcina sp. Marseille-Q4063 TaxID=2810514 RepID=UPI001BB04D47|nr:DUF6710 family protein [Sporosarcina sp. Marseille-Q4063]QUW22559.1 hypothetical protein JSQ81_02935 [Sporosarcina sp. Marseille-Q4063]
MIILRRKLSKAIKQRSDEVYISLTNIEIKNNFDSIMRFSLSVLDEVKELKMSEDGSNEETEHPLIDVVRLVGRQLQSQYLTNLLYQRDEAQIPKLLPEEVLFNPLSMITKEGTIFQDVIRELKTEYVISLNRDLVLPWSWKKSRLTTCIAQIGQGRKLGQWRQDYNNHHVELWLPMGIAWVYGGNHSISAGIIQGKGEIIPKSVYDISGVYDYVYCDGVNYYRKEDGSIISPVMYAEFAAIFEIGRIMAENSISY